MSGSDRSRARTIAIASAVQRDYAAVAGRVILLRAVSAYAKGGHGDAVDRPLDPPLEFRISSSAGSSDLNRVCDDWVDPFFDCEPVNPKDPQIADLESFWCYGNSYHRFDEKTEPGDAYVAPAKPPKKFLVSYVFKTLGALMIEAESPDEATAKAEKATTEELIEYGQCGGVELGAPEEQP